MNVEEFKAFLKIVPTDDLRRFETVCYAFDVSEKVTGNGDVSYTGWI